MWHDLEDLEDRVNKYFALQLPGQPQSAHVGTMNLVTDLWRKVQQLRDVAGGVSAGPSFAEATKGVSRRSVEPDDPR